MRKIKETEYEKIDIHCHVIAFPEYSPKHMSGVQLLTAEEQIAIHDKTNVDIGVLLPIVAPECQWAAFPSENCKYLVDKYPDRFAWFCNVDPRMGAFSPDTDLTTQKSHSLIKSGSFLPPLLSILLLIFYSLCINLYV